jgi:DNA-binding NtrC family response regulator
MLEGRRIVLVEDDEIMGTSLMQRLTLEGAEVQWHHLISRALPAIRTPRKTLDAVICDIRLPDGTGEELYDTLTRTSHPPPFLFITGQGGIDQAVRLIRSGAADYITKPFDIAAFLIRLATIMRPRADQEMPPETGITAAARLVDRQLTEAATRDTPLLIRGAQGLGKLRLARRVHELSDRRAAPILICNALRSRVGKSEIETAVADVGEGTLVVVGIDQLEVPAQDTLMAALTAARCLLIATLGLHGDDVEHGLRADLLALLLSHEIVVPTLADRPDDAVWLAAQLFPAFNARRKVPLTGLAATAEEAIRSYDWPGNGRELRARLMRAVEAAESGMVMASDLFPEQAAEREMRPLSEVRDAAEKTQIIAALDRTHGQVGEAARLLRVSRTTLWEKMQRLGL